MMRLFLSYARQDRPFVERLAQALTREGYQVWWDKSLAGGDRFAAEIETALNAADAVIVIWSKSSAASDWVRDEAGRARADGKLVPVSLESDAVALGFGALHTIDMSRFRGALTDPGMAELLRALDQQPGVAGRRPRTGFLSLLLRSAGVAAAPALAAAAMGSALQADSLDATVRNAPAFLLVTGPTALGLGAASAVRLARLGLKSTGALVRDMATAWAIGAAGALAIAALALAGDPNLILRGGLAGLALMVLLVSLTIGFLVGVLRAAWALVRAR